MKEAIELIISLALIWGAGVAGKEALMKLEGQAKLRIQKGLPHLSGYTTKLTHLKYDEKTGDLVSTETRHH